MSSINRPEDPNTGPQTEVQDEETAEWLDALDSLARVEGLARVDGILDAVVTSARRKGAHLPFAANTAYINTIPPEAQSPHPGNLDIEARIRHLVRWNATAIVRKEIGRHSDVSIPDIGG